MGNRQHDDVQNEKSLGANLSQLYEKDPKKKMAGKRGVTLLNK